jgi:glycosyltransferase involved in cell wall biosynthesis
MNSSPNKMFLQISLQKSGGGAVDAFEVSQSFTKLQFQHIVFLSTYNELKSRWSGNQFRNLIWIHTSQNKFNFFINSIYGWLNLILQVRGFRPNVIYVTHFHPWILPLSFFKKFLKFKLFYTVHENPFSPKERSSGLSLFMEKVLIKRADLIFTHSEFIRNQISGHVKVPIHIIPLGAYVNYFKNFKKVTPIDNKLRLLFFGRMEPYKGLEVLIEACKQLQERQIPFQVTIAGRGEIDATTLENTKELGISVINHWLSDQEIMQLFSEADVLLVPYTSASQSGVISLALAAHLPIIASRIGGLVEQVRDGYNGLLFPPKNTTALAAAIEKLAVDREFLKQLSQGSENLSRDVFSWDKNAAKIIELSNKLFSDN